MELLNRILDAIRIELRARATASLLETRGDRTLTDIGLDRADLLRVARAAAAAELRMAPGEIMTRLGTAERAVEAVAPRTRSMVDVVARFARGLPPRPVAAR